MYRVDTGETQISLKLSIGMQFSGNFFVLEVNMKKNNKKNQIMKCPYCGKNVVFRSADGVSKENKFNTMLYVCSDYPKCDAYVRVKPGTKRPMGTLADSNLRALRTEAHFYFDQLHESGAMTKQQAYQWLAYKVSAPLSQAHIGYMREYYCQRVIEECKKWLMEHNALREKVG